jgi:hypothetical protein
VERVIQTNIVTHDVKSNVENSDRMMERIEDKMGGQAEYDGDV